LPYPCPPSPFPAPSPSPFPFPFPFPAPSPFPSPSPFPFPFPFPAVSLDQVPLRVMSGRFRGRNLVSPPGKGTRPSSGRMRIAVHNILGPGGAEGASVLDLFAGTGASGIEALSRGARRALFVERARAPLEALERNLETLGLGDGEARVLRADAAAVLRGGAPLPFEPFDLVFCDPPYEVFDVPAAARSLREGLAALVARGGLAAGAVVVLEHPADRGFAIAPEGLREVDRRRYSAAGVTFYGALAPST
jgi:16S rRNA (guanine966-N2)-methyltransferase